MQKYVKLFVWTLACCIWFTASAMRQEVVSSDFELVATIDLPCTVAPGSSFQVVYTMANEGATTIPLQQVTIAGRTLNFPVVRTLFDLSGASLVSFIADAGTEFIDTPGIDFSRWQLTQPEGLRPGEVKQLTLTLQLDAAASEVNFALGAARNNTTSTCQRLITIPVSSTVVCPGSPITLRARVGTFGNLATITVPTTIFFDQPFNIEYTITNNQTFDIAEIIDNIFPLLQNSLGNDLYIVNSIDASEGSLVESDFFLYPPGRGQGSWLTPQLAPGQSAFLAISLTPTFRATDPLSFITRPVGNPACTFGPVTAQLTDPVICVFTDPIAQALAELLPTGINF